MDTRKYDEESDSGMKGWMCIIQEHFISYIIHTSFNIFQRYLLLCTYLSRVHSEKSVVMIYMYVLNVCPGFVKNANKLYKQMTSHESIR